MLSLLSRVASPAAHDVADIVAKLLAGAARPAPRHLGALVAEAAPAVPAGEHAPAAAAGLGMAATRIAAQFAAPPAPALAVEEPTPDQVPEPDDDDDDLFCPPAVRDDVALGEHVNDHLVEWADQVGIYPGQLDKVRNANFGRLMMLAHPATDDPDRLLASAKCVLAEWATDDHFLDDESLGADSHAIAARLGITYAAIDAAALPEDYAPHLERALGEEPVAVAYRSAFEHLARYATPTQVARLRHELCSMFMAYNHEAQWRSAGRTPPVFEYLVHRNENSFLPPMVLVDPVAGYELPAWEFADARVRRVFCLAGNASVILNDLYSMSRETDADFDLPKLIAAEESCSAEEAIRRTVRIHNELMRTFVAEATLLSAMGSPMLRRFLTDIWAWLGGNREWHSTTLRYNDPISSEERDRGA